MNVQTAVNAKATLPTEVTLYYTWGEGKATVADWDTSKVDVAKEGTYEATATAADVYGNEFNVTATVYVGALHRFRSGIRHSAGRHQCKQRQGCA